MKSWNFDEVMTIILIQIISVNDIRVDEYKQLLPSNNQLNTLKEDIKVNGIQIPLVINSNRILLDGYCMLQIVKTLI